MKNATDFVAPQGRAIFCIGYNAWGKGKTAKDAIKNWRAVPPGFLSGKKQVQVTLIEASEKAWVEDCFGHVMTPGGEAKACVLELRQVKV